MNSLENTSFESSQATLYTKDIKRACRTRSKESISDNPEQNPWLIVVGTFLVLVVGLGSLQSWGIMQNYFEQYPGFQGTPNLSLQLSFVATICNIIINLLGLVGQVLLSLFETRTVLFVSIVICSVGLLLASFSTQIWHLYLTQGVVYGIGSSIMFYIALSVVPQWFTKQKGVALGIISSGISIGGLIMPLIIEPLNTHLGAAWCYRIMSLICLVIGVISCLFFKTTKKSTEESGEKQSQKEAIVQIKDMFDLSVAKNWRFLLWVFIDILMESAYNVPYYFLPSYATFLGLSTSQGALVLSVGSGMNAIGRIASGLIADVFGHVNVIIIYSIISGLTSLFLWTYATTFNTLMAFSVLFGFFGGAFITLTPTITLLVTGYEKFETGLSVFLILTVISMFGPNLAGAIEVSAHASKEFDSYKYFTGACYLTGAILLVVFKFSLNRNFFAKI
ncbi:major facilitator superfamily domain-containing protein [Choanephora cucurbitarum]|nr:major facilitator superfamily domain-containing protein [Choanephora cucurbitarum]